MKKKNIFLFNSQLIPYKSDTHPVVDKPISYLYDLVLRPTPPKARVWGGPSIFERMKFSPIWRDDVRQKDPLEMIQNGKMFVTFTMCYSIGVDISPKAAI